MQAPRASNRPGLNAAHTTNQRRTSPAYVNPHTYADHGRHRPKPHT